MPLLPLSHCYPIRCTSYAFTGDGTVGSFTGVSIHRSSGYGFARPCSGSAAFSIAPLRLLPLPLWSTPLKLGVPLIDSAVPLGGLPPFKFRVPYKGKRIPFRKLIIEGQKQALSSVCWAWFSVYRTLAQGVGRGSNKSSFSRT